MAHLGRYGVLFLVNRERKMGFIVLIAMVGALWITFHD